MLSLYIPGQPRGKGRPRAVKIGNSLRLYTDAKTRAYETQIASIYKKKYGDKAGFQDKPVTIEIQAVYEIPKSATRAQRRQMMAGEILPLKKPDIDNVVKAIMDALQGDDMAYTDDKQVATITAEKRYETSKQPAGVYVTIKEKERKTELWQR